MTMPHLGDIVILCLHKDSCKEQSTNNKQAFIKFGHASICAGTDEGLSPLWSFVEHANRECTTNI